MNNNARVLDEWYQLFKKNHCINSNIQSQHWKNVTKLGLPKFKNSHCKYDVFKEFLKYHFIFHKKIILNEIHKYNKFKPFIDSYMLVFINGNFIFELSDLLIAPWILEFDNNINNYHFMNPINPDLFLYLTECLSHSITRIILPKNTTIAKPLYLLYITEGSEVTNQLFTSHYYHNLIVEQDTEACVIEHFVSFNNYGYFNGNRMLISVGERSKLNHIKLIFENNKSYHICHQDLYLKKSSYINSNTFIIGPKFAHHQINAQINYSNVSSSLNSLVFLSKKNVSEVNTYVEHNNKDYSISRQLHKIIATNSSTGMFSGLIKVNKDAIKTDATMINNNLLLQKSASIYSIPRLEIYSDAVQCSHGSTIGKISTDHLFYLSTRGFSKEYALKILIYGFIEEIIKKIKFTSLKKYVKQKINQDLNGSI